MENFCRNFFEDVRHEKSLIILLALTDEGILRPAGFTEHGLKMIKNLAEGKLQRKTTLLKHTALQSLDSFFSVY